MKFILGGALSAPPKINFIAGLTNTSNIEDEDHGLNNLHEGFTGRAWQCCAPVPEIKPYLLPS